VQKHFHFSSFHGNVAQVLGSTCQRRSSVNPLQRAELKFAAGRLLAVHVLREIKSETVKTQKDISRWRQPSKTPETVFG
jgi:hypothetical protein